MKTGTADAILAELTQYGWTKNTNMDGDGRICAGQAVNQALLKNPALAQDSSSGLGLWGEIAQKGFELFPARRPRADPRQFLPTVAMFNDHKDTTEEDLRLVIKHCVED